MTRDKIIEREFEHVRCRTASTGAKPARRIQLMSSIDAEPLPESVQPLAWGWSGPLTMSLGELAAVERLGALR